MGLQKIISGAFMSLLSIAFNAEAGAICDTSPELNDILNRSKSPLFDEQANQMTGVLVVFNIQQLAESFQPLSENQEKKTTLVRAVQESLNEYFETLKTKGLFLNQPKLSEDGTIGPSTAKAIIQFAELQRNNDLLIGYTSEDPFTAYNIGLRHIQNTLIKHAPQEYARAVSAIAYFNGAEKCRYEEMLVNSYMLNKTLTEELARERNQKPPRLEQQPDRYFSPYDQQNKARQTKLGL